MIPPRNNLGPIIGINLKFFGAVVWAALAWLIWPDTLKGYGWAFLAIVMWLIALRLVIDALGVMIKLYRRDKAIAAMLADAKPVKSERLATDDKLRAAGVLDD